jgi:hypothetical protein
MQKVVRLFDTGRTCGGKSGFLKFIPFPFLHSNNHPRAPLLSAISWTIHNSDAVPSLNDLSNNKT